MQRSHIGNAFTNLHEGNTQSSHIGNAFIDLHVGNITYLYMEKNTLIHEK